MAVSDERNDPAGTVYGAARRRRARPGLPGDPLMRIALAIGLVGVLLGAFFATGVLGGGGQEPVLPAAAATQEPAADESPTAAEPTVEPIPTVPAEPSPTPTPEATTPSAPPAPAGPPTGPQLFRTVTSGLCVGLAGGEPEGADATLVDCTGSPDQQWVATPVNGDVVTLTNAATGKCLDVDGGSGDDGAVVQQWSCQGQANQQWRIVAIGTGPVLLTPVHSGKCVRIHDNATTAGAYLEQATCTATAEQQWTLG
ncbi:RICIN domain-containing protein [Micromonospora mirobrigensis]|uniref:Ricin-type beta-trefoil lectin domain-like n=1 Tax=Micromonospora mirobrigensis TaxID=262898 RepID=A0A1C4UFM2_9ACTN|nr:RICIN domain-containing protein [Micromonospora mirobrigensis]SCE70463.1 Ricin-type beta-trefoil lectin domain-like [Micromonospora mirobrigensis]